jgi:ribosomal protein S2
MLTNQGYEFLFRMKEVDEEIQLTIEQLKLKEYIKRKKFSSAVRQSYELIKMVRQKKKDLESFILSVRQNIHSVDIEQYEALMKCTYSMLAEEY